MLYISIQDAKTEVTKEMSDDLLLHVTRSSDVAGLVRDRKPRERVQHLGPCSTRSKPLSVQKIFGYAGRIYQ